MSLVFSGRKLHELRASAAVFEYLPIQEVSIRKSSLQLTTPVVLRRRDETGGVTSISTSAPGPCTQDPVDAPTLGVIRHTSELHEHLQRVNFKSHKDIWRSR